LRSPGATALSPSLRRPKNVCWNAERLTRSRPTGAVLRLGTARAAVGVALGVLGQEPAPQLVLVEQLLDLSHDVLWIVL